jgi:hypothetical protein
MAAAVPRRDGQRRSPSLSPPPGGASPLASFSASAQHHPPADGEKPVRPERLDPDADARYLADPCRFLLFG